MTLETIDLRRLGAALVVILLHAAVIALVLHTVVTPRESSPSTREIILQFLQRPTLTKPATAQPLVRLIAPMAPSRNTITTPPPTVNGTGLQGLHQYLFNCALENLGLLTPEQRAQCASQALGPNPDETNSLRNLPSRALDARHWARGLARKQNPILLPCMSSAGIGVSPQMLVCLGKGAIKGFGDLDEGPGYGDAPPVEVHVPNNGDPVQPYSPR
jgi:hypothetical protein